MPNHYQILGINMRATAEQIRLAYKQKAVEFHPDKHAGSVVHEEQFKKIAEAYRVLSDSKKKNVYDMSLFYQSAVAGFGGKSAETKVPPVYRNVPQPMAGERPNPADSPNTNKAEPRFGLQTLSVFLLILASLIMIGFWVMDIVK